MYAYYKKLDYFSTECVYAPNAYRGFAREFLKDAEVLTVCGWCWLGYVVARTRGTLSSLCVTSTTLLLLAQAIRPSCIIDIITSAEALCVEGESMYVRCKLWVVRVLLPRMLTHTPALWS